MAGRSWLAGSFLLVAWTLVRPSVLVLGCVCSQFVLGWCRRRPLQNLGRSTPPGCCVVGLWSRLVVCQAVRVAALALSRTSMERITFELAVRSSYSSLAIHPQSVEGSCSFQPCCGHYISSTEATKGVVIRALVNIQDSKSIKAFAA